MNMNIKLLVEPDLGGSLGRGRWVVGCGVSKINVSWRVVGFLPGGVVHRVAPVLGFCGRLVTLVGLGGLAVGRMVARTVGLGLAVIFTGGLVHRVGRILGLVGRIVGSGRLVHRVGLILGFVGTILVGIRDQIKNFLVVGIRGLGAGLWVGLLVMGGRLVNGGFLGGGFRVTGGRRIGGGVLGAGRGKGLHVTGALGGEIGGRRMGRPTGVGGLGGVLLGVGIFHTGGLIPDSPGVPLAWPKVRQNNRPTIAQTNFILIAFKSSKHSDLYGLR